jgi:NhaA family Na+:H+ antiporter
VLLVAAALALVCSNSPWGSFYADLWHVPIGFHFGRISFERDLHFWINDALMTAFFFVVGLEIRSEIHSGAGKIRRAALPVAAALGGMLLPALIFLTMNAGRQSASGWAIPTATDIAFALGTFALLGRRVAPNLRLMLLKLAVIDDVGAIFVIALFYSSNLSASGLIVLGLGILTILCWQILGIRSTWVYVPPALVLWWGTYLGGIHPAMAGVILGLLTPVASSSDNRTMPSTQNAPPTANREAVSPAEHLRHSLHPWVAFVVMPLFAFANAGVTLQQVSLEHDLLWAFLGLVLGLTVGKPLGILGLSWMAVRLGFTSLPARTPWSAISVAGMAAGIGFTMALFVAQLAFPAGPLLEVSKLAVLCGSFLSGAASVIVGRRILKMPPTNTSGTAWDPSLDLTSPNKLR